MVKNRYLLIFSIPAIIYIIWYVMYPTIILIGSAFTVGEGSVFDNLLQILDDENYLKSIMNAFIYGIGISFFGILLSVLCATFLYSVTSKKMITTIQVSTFIPYLLSWVVIIGVFNLFFNSNGLVDIIYHNFGGSEQSLQLWSNTTFSRFAVIFMTIWKDLGYNTLIFYAALLTIPKSLIEAVSLEKNTYFNKFKSVYLPQLRTTIFTMFFLILVGGLKTFDSANLVSNSINKEGVQTPAVYVYELGVIKGETNLADAAALIFMVICIVIVVVVRKVTNEKDI